MSDYRISNESGRIFPGGLESELQKLPMRVLGMALFAVAAPYKADPFRKRRVLVKLLGEKDARSPRVLRGALIAGVLAVTASAAAVGGVFGGWWSEPVPQPPKPSVVQAAPPAPPPESAPVATPEAAKPDEPAAPAAIAEAPKPMPLGVADSTRSAIGAAGTGKTVNTAAG